MISHLILTEPHLTLYASEFPSHDRQLVRDLVAKVCLEDNPRFEFGVFASWITQRHRELNEALLVEDD